MKYNNYIIAKTNRLARQLKKAGSPVTSKDAAELWNLCSSSLSLISADNAIKLYRKAGYVPFRGYPLERSL